MKISKILKSALICSLGLILPVLGITLANVSAEGDNEGGKTPVLTIEAEDGSLAGGASASGNKVGNLGKSGGSTDRTVTFKSLAIPCNGEYILKVYYMSGSDDRYFNVTTDYGTYKLDCPSTGGFDKTGDIELTVDLKAGGFITFGSEWYAPDLDKIELYETVQYVFPDREYSDPSPVTYDDPSGMKLILDTNNGVYSVLCGNSAVITNARAETVIDGVTVSSDDFKTHESSVKENKTVVFTHKDHPGFEGVLTQYFDFSDNSYILTKTVISASENNTVTTNYISALSTYKGGVTIDKGVMVQIPFDNDMWVEPSFTAVKNIGHPSSSYEVTAFYNNETYASLVVGSVLHDVWKSRIDISAQRGEVMAFTCFAGASDNLTRDNSPHGSVSGSDVSSPIVFIGYFDDWREGMTQYGKANAEITPPKQSSADVPFGYNSWGSLQDKVKYSDMIDTSEFVHKYLQENWKYDDGAIYINIDSFWDFIVHNDPKCSMTLDTALKKFVDYCHKNGQKAGIYFTPFSCWYGSESELRSNRLQGIDGVSYTFYDAAIKKSDGSGLYGKLDGGWALDPTHPATIKRYEDQLKQFIKLGFEYVKLDFMTHGAVEGLHFDPKVTTGIQAYNSGMARIHEICNGKMYVNLSIAPLFPYQYADGRRISCDAFSSLDNTMHVLSHLTAGFWEKEIYPYPDPDHMVVLGVSEGVARCRVTAGAISGTSFIIGDDLTNIKEGSADYKRIIKMYGNKNIISVAKLGRAFMPYSVTPGARCADAYFCVDNGILYLALFNFENTRKDFSIDISKLTDSLPDGTVATELWTGKVSDLSGDTFKCKINSENAALYRIGLPLPVEENSASSENENENPGTTPKDEKKPLSKGGIVGFVSCFVCAAVFLTLGYFRFNSSSFFGKKNK